MARLIIGRTGSGNTHRLQQLIDAHAADPTTTVWAITPYTDLAGVDRHTDPNGAEQMLTELLAEVDKRLARGREHTPTQAEPHIRLIVDRVELVHELLGRAELGRLLGRLIITGRTAAVDTLLTASTTHLDVWPDGVRQHFDRPGCTEILPDRRTSDED
ncbi:hypothetical protein ACFWA9_04600 [Kitasatospora sp. NPDC059973]|uniref:hypothetical protein n=1 Tax=Kitasatospora sp. NPDC059973 TaxID=3347020 RepID=UPI00367A0EA9